MKANEVFSRTAVNSSGKEISANLYNLIIGGVLCWGFLVNWWMVQVIPAESLRAINPIIFLGGYFLSAFVGIYMFTASTNPVVSFIGYNFVVFPLGLIVDIIVSRYHPELVLNAIRVTGLVTAMMMILGTLYPAFFLSIGRALGVALLCLILARIFEMIFLRVDTAALDWISAGIFCGYIGYDWARANQIPKTIDNAVDAAAALYIDIINLFLDLLRIMGRKR